MGFVDLSMNVICGNMI